MKIQILSDLHIEFAPYNIVQTDADVIILAGDIHLGINGLKWIQQQNQLIQDKHFIYVLGNHEFYNHTAPNLIHDIQLTAENTNIHVLENESIKIGNVKFLGCTFWTDFQLFNDKKTSITNALYKMSDFEIIWHGSKNALLHPSDTVDWNNESRQWLKNEIETTQEECLVIITHHAPSMNSVPENYKTDILTAAFASHMDDFAAQSKVDLWIHGHMHTSSDYYIDQTRVICNPLAYPHERNSQFNPELVIEICSKIKK